MDQKWIQILVILVFYHKVTSGADQAVKEGEPVMIKCELATKGTMIIWFRAMNSSGMEFIASYSQSGVEKSKSNSFSEIFSQGNPNSVTVKAFKQSRDSGIYCCASLVAGKELTFGTVTRLSGEEIKKNTIGPSPTKPPKTQIETTTPCNCNTKKTAGTTTPALSCSIIILGPLAGGCGLLLLLLIVTIVYCNRIRTRRCPHHYKRKPRVAPEKQMVTNRHA